MITILILLTIYIISAYLAYKYNQIAHSINGRFEDFNPGIREFIFTFLPIVNTLFSLIGWVFHHPSNKDNNLNKFFKVKKD